MKSLAAKILKQFPQPKDQSNLPISGSQAPLKQKIRNVWLQDDPKKRGDDFIHINDNFYQTYEYCRLFFNKNSFIPGCDEKKCKPYRLMIISGWLTRKQLLQVISKYNHYYMRDFLSESIFSPITGTSTCGHHITSQQ